MSQPARQRQDELKVNYTKCDSDTHVFCGRQQVCLPKHVNCTDPVMFDYFSVSPFANKSGRFTLTFSPTPLELVVSCVTRNLFFYTSIVSNV